MSKELEQHLEKMLATYLLNKDRVLVFAGSFQ